ncbi:mediator of RNA polymerase II transcription subunit 1-like [Magallana gigas]|uniref:mediator of RNA polymerase II transcription subunit 1-like n=1 Tax=Magallana gigas TaxID=29159 RepID=UPI003341CA9D
MFTKSSAGNIKSLTMKEFLLIVSLSLVFLSVESYRQKYHGKYFQYGPYGRSSLSGLRGGLSGGFDEGFRTTSFSGSSLDDFNSLGSLGSLSSVSRRSLLPGRYTYQKHGHSSTYPKYFDLGRTFRGSRNFGRDLSFSSASVGSGLSGLSGLDDNFGNDFSSRSIAPISTSSSAILSGPYPRAFPKLGGYTKSLKTYPSIRSIGFSSRSGLGLSGGSGLNGFDSSFDDDFSSIAPFSASSSSSAYHKGPYPRAFPKLGGYTKSLKTYPSIRSIGFSSRSGLGLSGGSGLNGFDSSFDDDFSSIAPFSASSSSSAYPKGPYSHTFPKLEGYTRSLRTYPSIRYNSFSSRSGLGLSGGSGLNGFDSSFDDDFSSVAPFSASAVSAPLSGLSSRAFPKLGGYTRSLETYPSIRSGGFSSSSGLSLSGLRGFEDDGFSSISPLSSLPQRGFSASSGLSLSGLQGLDDDSFSSISPAPILPQNSYRADPYSDLSYPKPLPAFRGGLTGLQRNDLTLSSRLDDDFSALGGGTRSNLIRSGSFDDDDFGDSLGLRGGLDSGFGLSGSNSFLSSSQLNSGALLKPETYLKPGPYPKLNSRVDYI